jgi:hypothetical protein
VTNEDNNEVTHDIWRHFSSYTGIGHLDRIDYFKGQTCGSKLICVDGKDEDTKRFCERKDFLQGLVAVAAVRLSVSLNIISEKINFFTKFYKNHNVKNQNEIIIIQNNNTFFFLAALASPNNKYMYEYEIRFKGIQCHIQTFDLGLDK